MPISRKIFFLSLVIFGCISLTLGKDFDWDVLSYHFYTPYALLHHRYDFDYWPSGYIQMYLNPLLDFSTYFLLQFAPAKIAVFTIGAIHGVNFWLLFLLAHQVVSHYEKNYLNLYTIFLAALGMYGAVDFFEINSFMGDTTVSIFILSSLYLILKTTKKMHLKLILASGFLFGLAVGFKLTGNFFVFGFWLIIAMMKDRGKNFLLWNLTAFAGFMLTNGYWMWFLWQHFHNPFYPLFNGIFHAADFPWLNWHEVRYMPQNWLEVFFYPLYFTFHQYRVSDYNFLDLRYLILYGLFYVSILTRKLKKQTIPVYLFIFCIPSFVAWECLSGFLRYATVLEMLTPILIYSLVKIIFKKPVMQISVLFGIFVAMIITMIPLQEPKAVWSEHSYYGVKLPEFVQDLPEAMVISIAPDFIERSKHDYYTNETHTLSLPADVTTLTRDSRAITYLVPFFPKGWRFTGVIVSPNTVHYVLSEKLKTTIANYHGQIYLLTSEGNLSSFYRFAQLLSLHKNGECGQVLSDPLIMPPYQHQRLLLCPVKV